MIKKKLAKKKIGDKNDKGGNMREVLMRTPPDGFVTIGLSKGVTLNMGNYQSARIDAFLIKNVPNNEEAIEEGFNKIADVLDERLLIEMEKDDGEE